MWYGLLKFPMLFIVLSYYISWGCGLTVQKYRKLFPFESFHNIDLITNLSKSKEFNSILSMVNHSLTKGIILVPTTKGVTLKGIITLLIDNLFQRFGISNKVISDQDPWFIAKSIKVFLQRLEIK